MAGTLNVEAAALEPAAACHEAGPAAPTRQITHVLAVENMHCGSCMLTVERTLSEIPGVISARASLSARRVSVTVPQAGPDIDRLLDALENAGFRASPMKTGGQQQAHAARQFLAYLAVAGFAAANIMLLSVSVWAGLVSDMGPAAKTLFHWLSALIALPTIAYAGQPFFRSALGALSARRLNMDVPISLGVILATGISLYHTVKGTEQVYFDAAVTLLFFLLIGRYLDTAMRVRAAGAAANLLGLISTMATVVRADGGMQRLASHALEPGDVILVAAGERIAADGIVIGGEGEIDESLITGETKPRNVKPGESVHAGTVNIGHPLRVEAISTDDGTLIAGISRMMAAAEQGRGRYVRLADRAARIYAPAVHLLGLSTFLGWIALGYGWEPALTAAIAVLIITCPCALALAVPAAQVAATSRLFANGVVLKAADGLERLAEVDAVVLDKTGTLTLPEPRLGDLREQAEAALPAAASLAAHSRHPYARALAAAARERKIALSPSDGIMEVAGSGLCRTTSAGEERLGSASWCGAKPDAASPDIGIWYRTADGEIVGYPFVERLRTDASDVLSKLKTAGLSVELLSGDRQDAVIAAARSAGIRRALAGVRPDGKMARLDELRSQGARVLMVGDGLNDAPALAAAHASLSPSTAADISQNAADGVFQGERLGPIIEVLAVARAARRTALQNFAIAIGYNILFVPLAVAGAVTPLIAAVAMSASSLAVTVNALRLRSQRIELRSLR
ncbi:MAG: heavy metal translocating P-type ATPase [Hyphomicrobiaceae bacterium]